VPVPLATGGLIHFHTGFLSSSGVWGNHVMPYLFALSIFFGLNNLIFENKINSSAEFQETVC
jgi:hypothetical protein